MKTIVLPRAKSLYNKSDSIKVGGENIVRIQLGLRYVSYTMYVKVYYTIYAILL